MFGDGACRPLRVFQSGRADVDPAAAGGQGDLQRLGVADAARELDLKVEAADDVGDDLAVVAAAEGCVEVDQVDPFGALVLPAFGGQPGVTELPARAGYALLELNGPALGDVDGGEQFEAGHGRSPSVGALGAVGGAASVAPSSPSAVAAAS